MYPRSIANLIESFKYFPGIGEKTAERMAFYLLSMDEIQTDFLANSIIDVKKKIKKCKKCNNLTENELCDICQDNTRSNLLCVVEDPKTIMYIEKLGIYNGYYFVLNGLISTINGINPENIGLEKLVSLIEKNNYKEVIIAVKPCLEGEMTSLYVKSILEDLNVDITRLASGIPMGADMEYVDAITLEKAFDNRKKIS